MICKNCGHHFSGNYCSNCGQKSNIKKIDYNYLIHELPSSIFQINRGFLFTVLKLATRPGHSVREFLDGKRKNYFKPVPFLFLTSTIYIFFNYLIANDTFMDDFIAGIKLSELNNNNSLKWFSDNKTYLVLAIIPLFSVASYLAFLKSKYNYVEHLVLNFYTTGQQMLIYLMFSFISMRDSSLTLIPLSLGMLFNIWSYAQFFSSITILKRIIRIAFTYLIFSTIVMMGLFVLVGLLK